jgi:hypothetical protein
MIMNDDKFLEEVLVFVDSNGTIVSKTSTNMSCSLKMKYEDDDLKIKMHAYSHGMGNGSCGAEVRYKGKKVYEASGSFTSSPYDVKVKQYVPGKWEKLMGL